jgi:hypothetical protein
MVVTQIFIAERGMSATNKSVKRITTIFLAIIGSAFFQFSGFGWGSAGHMVIAAEAFQQLAPESKAQAFEVLKAHPDFAKWAKAYHPNPTIDLAAYVFMRAATWPDEIRKTGDKYDHPEWHFIDYPLRPPSFLLVADPRPTNNVLYGIAECEKTLSDTNANPELRAAYLSYLVHLIGDLHQPLHCESFFNDDYPDGDRGGNDFYVMPANQPLRLHGIWDGLLGSAMNPQTQWKYAIQLDNKFPRSSLSELTDDTTPLNWSLASRKLAIDKGYLNGQLKGSKDENSAPPLPAGYLTAAKACAERQGALAGYRLADEIQTYLKTAGFVPLLPANTNTAVQMAPKKISALEAKNYYDQSMIVTGKVVQVSARSAITILDIDQPYPNTPCTAVVFNENKGQFDDLNKYQNQRVEISGTITEYHNKPEIILESPQQIKVVGQ